MKVESPCPPEPLVDHLTDQRVRHRQAPRAVLHQQTRRDRVVGRVEQAIPIEPTGGDEHRQRGCLPGDGGQVQDLHHDWIEPIEADTEHVANRVGKIRARLAVGIADQLGQEERVAAGGGAQLGSADRFMTVQLEQRTDLARAEHVDRDACQQAVTAERGGDPVQLGRRIVGG